jgi:hypothetical protein
VLDANPLDDPAHTRGRMWEGETLDEVWPRQRALPSFLWQKNRPAVDAGIPGGANWVRTSMPGVRRSGPPAPVPRRDFLSASLPGC